MSGGRTAVGYGGRFGVRGVTRYEGEADSEYESRRRMQESHDLYMQQRLGQGFGYSPLELVSTGVSRILKHVSYL
jgi:hypothetical protein